MKEHFKGERLLIHLLLVLAISPGASNVTGQTKVVLPRNDYPLSEDIKRGKEGSAQVESKMAVVKDEELTSYVQSLGNKLEGSVPPEHRRPEFSYSFKIVHDRQINAFALPGGPIYLFSGLLERAETEGEIAGVIAHEISHVVLRHGMAGQTRIKDTAPARIIDILKDKTVCATLGNLCGILVTIHDAGTSSFLNVYERQDETAADVLGTQILFKAGYSTRDMVATLRMLKGLGGENIPPWMKDHPNIDERIARVEHEAKMFPSTPPNRFQTDRFEQFKARLLKLYPTGSSSGRAGVTPPESEKPAPASGNKKTVPLPAAEFNEISTEGFRLSVPSNWQVHGKETLFIAPAGAYSHEHGITHGVMLGVHQEPDGDAETTLKTFLSSILSANSYLQMRGTPVSATLSGEKAIKVVLAGKSPVTDRVEIVTLHVLLGEGVLFYLNTVAPQDEHTAYESAFGKIAGSLRLGSK